MSDSTTSTSVSGEAITERRVVLRDVSWSTYESLLDDLADQSSPRLAYDDGILEIMTPLVRHETLNRTLATLVGTLAEELGIDIQDCGSTTFHVKATAGPSCRAHCCSVTSATGSVMAWQLHSNGHASWSQDF